MFFITHNIDLALSQTYFSGLQNTITKVFIVFYQPQIFLLVICCISTIYLLYTFYNKRKGKKKGKKNRKKTSASSIADLPKKTSAHLNSGGPEKPPTR